MIRSIKKIFFLTVVFICTILTNSFAQKTQIRGFNAALSTYEKGILSFGFSEQDILITSELSDALSFVGETVFKYDHHSSTQFSVSVERIIIKYNYKGNHNILIGKQHTPINFWNDNYHHGRFFYPTAERPQMFSSNVIPIHTTGISFQGSNLGKLKFGYDFMIGSGLGSTETLDNDKYKSITTAVHIKPANGLRIGGSYYYDVVSKGAQVHYHEPDLRHEDRVNNYKVKQHLFTGSVAYFGNKVELLVEPTFGVNHTDTTCYQKTFAGYLYTGLRITEKIIPYFRIENLDFEEGEVFFIKNNTTAYQAGIRYDINYLANIKLEFQHIKSQLDGKKNRLSAQFAISF
jgi:hypothetical protein